MLQVMSSSIIIAETIEQKRAVITRLIPALTRNDGIKKAEAAKTEEFTRCRVIKLIRPC